MTHGGFTRQLSGWVEVTEDVRGERCVCRTVQYSTVQETLLFDDDDDGDDRFARASAAVMLCVREVPPVLAHVTRKERPHYDSP